MASELMASLESQTGACRWSPALTVPHVASSAYDMGSMLLLHGRRGIRCT